MSGLLSAFRRVSKREPCSVCGKPDWCLVSRDTAGRVLCTRVESPIRWKAGWLHGDVRRRAGPRRYSIDERPTYPNVEAIGNELRELGLRDVDTRTRVAGELGVSTCSLLALGAGLTSRGLAFPMSDHLGRVVGIRYRRSDGSKSAERGSRNGLFLPTRGVEEQPHVVVCEGPTDTCAALTLGFYAIGRPDCTGGTDFLVRWLRARTDRTVTVLSDADEPGRRGAHDLAAALALLAACVRIVLPPRGAKDLRAALALGATHEELLASIEAAPRIVPEIRRSAS